MFPNNEASLSFVSTRLWKHYRGRNCPNIDVCRAGRDIYDASAGFMYQYWRASRNKKGHIYIEAMTTGARYKIDEVPPGNGNFTFAFDNNMRPIVCVELNGTAMLRWFDPTQSKYVIDTFANIETPFVRIDDCEDETGDVRDAILVYERNDKIYFRLLRERFTIERFFANIHPWQILYQCGMNVQRRFQCDLVWDHHRIYRSWQCRLEN